MGVHRPAQIALILLLTGCAAAPSLAPSPPGSSAGAPLGSASVDPAPSATPFLPSIGTWVGFEAPVRDVVFGPAGDIYVSLWEPGVATGAIHRLNANLQEAPGWPVNVEGSPNLLMDGTSLMASVCELNLGPCHLHRFRDDGTESQGFPVTTLSGCYEMRLAWDVAVVLACSQDGNGQLLAVDRSGNKLNGWPVTVKGFRSFGTAEDGRLYARSVPSRGELRVDVFGRNGRPEPGWPVRLPLSGNPQGVGGIRPHPSGMLMAWWLEGVVPDQICMEADRTVMTVLAADGSVVPDWPITVEAVGSGPAVATVGWSWMRFGGAQEVIAGYDELGREKDGWPVGVAADPCLPGGPAAVDLLSDGLLALVQGNTMSLWAGDGAALDGWPLTVEGAFATGCQPSPCMPGGNGAIAPVVTSRDRTMYLVEYIGQDFASMQAQLDAFDLAGQPVAGFPIPIPHLACYPQTCSFAAPQVIDVRPTTVGAGVVVIAAEGLFVVR